MVIRVDAHKLAYMALPKAGCSSVKEALARIDPAVTLPAEHDITVETWHAIYPTQRFRKHRWIDLDGHFRFCVVRDPIKRLLSVYTNRVLEFGDLRNSRNIRRGHVDLPVDPDPDFFFTNLEAYKAASSSINHHAIAADIFLGGAFNRYSRVYRTEELGQLAWDLSLWTRQDVAMPRGNASESALSLDDLKGQTIDAIRPFLDHEYSFLSDYYQNPLGGRLYDACVTQTRRVS
jgi:hypothetical protein